MHLILIDMKLPLGLFVVLAFAFAATVAGQGSPLVPPGGRVPGTLDQPVHTALGLDYLSGFLVDTGSIFHSAVDWRPSAWLRLSILAFAMGRLSGEEDDLQTWVQHNRTPATDRLARFARCLGDGKYVVPALGALYGYGEVARNSRARSAALMSLEGIAVSGVFTESIKLLTHKHRPGAKGVEDSQWDGPRMSGSNLSFPSGHSAAAFAVATVMASEYGDHRVVPPLAYGAAALCALSRMNDNAHWTSDVLVGSAIGYFTAGAVVALHGGKRNLNLTILPAVEYGHAALSVACSF